ncbi:hypothetical protein M2352_000342 [Azospirillum fermentarium]|uniref:hypothetical protein n=1 Tax=Azospirillum fermentarium TaxID=1233114 RepID=UPI00222603A6|nr:hypothetical protein [Azospirillum fermentarium]MCW2244751.1 hypothetical protein [Azospirillum fermentarium]
MAGTGLPIKDLQPVTTQPAPIPSNPVPAAEAEKWAAVARIGDQIGAFADKIQAGLDAREKARLETDAENTVTDLMARHPNDPGAFRQGLEAARNGVLGTVSLRYGDVARNAYDAAGARGYRTVVRASVEQARKTTADALDARADRLTAQVMGFAAAGNTADMAQALDSYARLTDETV